MASKIRQATSTPAARDLREAMREAELLFDNWGDAGFRREHLARLVCAVLRQQERVTGAGMGNTITALVADLEAIDGEDG
jgi:mevalonate kinase